MSAPSYNIMYCTIHPSIQIKHRKRSGEWLQLMKECPLCTADGNDSEWSSGSCASTSGSSSCSSGSESCYTSPFRLQQQRKNKRVRQATISTSFSKFKECKDEEQSSKDRESTADFTTLPFSSNVGVPTKDAKSDPGDSLMFQHRQEKIRQMKMRGSMHYPTRRYQHSNGDKSRKAKGKKMTPEMRSDNKLKLSGLVPPSQRYRKFTVGSTSSDKANGSFHSETTYLSEVSHHNGTVTKERQQPESSNGIPTRSFHSESTKHWSNAKSSNRTDDSSLERMLSTLEISYDSFCSPNEFMRVDSGEITVGTDNTSPSKTVDNNINNVVRQDRQQDTPTETFSHMDSIHESEISNMQVIDESNEDLHKATRDIWGSSNDSSPDYDQGEGNMEENEEAKNSSRGQDSTTLRHLKNDESVVVKEDFTRNNGDAMTQTPKHSKKIPFEKMARKLHSLRVSSIRNKSREQRSKRKEIDEVFTGDDVVAEDSLRGDDGRVDHRLSAGSAKDQKPSVGRKFAKSLKQSSYHSKPDPPGMTGPPGVLPIIAEEQDNMSASKGLDEDDIVLNKVTSPEERRRKKLRAEQDALVNKSLDDEDMAFNKVYSLSFKGRDRIKLLSRDDLEQIDCPSDPSSTRSRDPPDIHSISTEERDPTLANEGLEDKNTAFRKVNTPSPKGRERKKLRVHDGVQETGCTSDQSMNSRASHSSSSTGDRKGSSSKDNEKKERPFDLQTNHSSSRSRNPTGVDGVGSKSDIQSGTSTQTNLMPKPLKEGNMFLSQDSDSSADSKQMFNKCDSKGRCVHHPHIQLRKRKRIGGWKKGRWKIVVVNCTECCFEEVQRLRSKNLHAKKNLLLSKSTGLPPSSSVTPSNGDDTSTTASLSVTSSSSNDSSTNSNRQMKSSPKKPTPVGGSDSDSLTNSTESELTTTFSYLSSLSSDTRLSSAAGSTSSSSGAKHLHGVLRQTSSEISTSRMSRDNSLSSSKNSGKSNVSRVVFAGRDDIIYPAERFVS